MLIAEPRRSEPAMLIGIRNRDEHAVDRGEWLVIAGGGQNPQAAGSACASDVGGELVDEIHVAIAREQRG